MKMKCLAQGHNTGPQVRFEPTNSWYLIRHATKCTVLMVLAILANKSDVRVQFFLALVAILFSGSELVWTMLVESYDEHLCDNILNLGQKFKRRCVKKYIFLALVAILFGGSNICVKLF